MRNKWLVLALCAGATLAVARVNDADPVLMNVAGKDVTKSEFEYLYHKNNKQQLEKQTLPEYVQMFINYKLKVAEAANAGIDTTRAFIKEFNEYNRDLMAPYLVDTIASEKLAREAYARMDTEVDASHILILCNDYMTKEMQAEKLKLAEDVLKQLKEGADFAAMAKKYSDDKGSKESGGRLGYFRPFTMVYPFEMASFSLKPGEISGIVKSQFGYHIIKCNNRRKSLGEVQVCHIMSKYPQKRDISESEKAEAKKKIDLAYSELQSGADFTSVVAKYSDDNSSKDKGGMMNWFGSGMLPTEFDSVAFSLKNGETSKPFSTRFGWHIIKRLNSRGLQPYEELRSAIKAKMSNDERGKCDREAKLVELRKNYGFIENKEAVNKIKQFVDDAGKFDRLAYNKQFAKDNTVLFTVAGKQYTIADFVAITGKQADMPAPDSMNFINEALKGYGDDLVLDCEKKNLAIKYPEYRNLINEFHDGMMLFEISNREVWEKASNDKAGLAKYFNDNKDKYKWGTEHFKGYLIQAVSDSIANVAKARIPQLGVDTLAQTLRREFTQNGKRLLRVDYLIVEKGENKIVDAHVFNGNNAVADKKYPVSFVTQYKILNAPEEYTDVRGLVVNDYQNSLDADWIKMLRKKYPVKVYDKVLKKVK